MKAFFRETLVTLILAVVIFFTLQAVVKHVWVPSSSMQPTLQIGQHLLINKVVYKFHEPERGDIAVFYLPNKPQVLYIKRLIALPGESVEIKGGIVYIHKNGEVFPLNEPYIKEPPSQPFAGGTIPRDEYFFLGDNRNDSGDSRNGWTVPRNNMVGKAWLSIWPPNEWGLVAQYPLEEQLVSPTHKQAAIFAEGLIWQ